MMLRNTFDVPPMVKAHVVDREHPIFKGVADFELDDETFYLLTRAPAMHVLLEAPLP